MRVLVACEFSGTVRDAFIKLGHEAVSCDLLPTDVPGPHYHGSVLDILDDGWDLMVAHPPCTYLSNAGAARLYPQKGVIQRLEDTLYHVPRHRRRYGRSMGWVMNNKVKKRKHQHRFDRCMKHFGNTQEFQCRELSCGIVPIFCRCGKVRPLNNKVEG